MSNPLAALTTYHNTTEQDKLMGTGYVTMQTFQFSVTSRIGLDLTYQNQHIWTLYYFSTENQNSTTNVTDNLNKYNTWLWENFATYSRDFGDHSLTVMAGYSAQEAKLPLHPVRIPIPCTHLTWLQKGMSTHSKGQLHLTLMTEPVEALQTILWHLCLAVCHIATKPSFIRRFST